MESTVLYINHFSGGVFELNSQEADCAVVSPKYFFEKQETMGNMHFKNLEEFRSTPNLGVLNVENI